MYRPIIFFGMALLHQSDAMGKFVLGSGWRQTDVSLN